MHPRVWRTLPGWVLAACVLVAAPAAAQPAQQDLDAIRELTLHARFEDAITAARALLERDDLDAATRNAGLEVLAVAQIANRDREGADETLQLLYSRDPGHRLTDPDASPPVISAFALARESEPEQVTVTLEHRPPTLDRREPPNLEVRVSEGADAVAEVRLVYRAGSDGEARVVMTRQADGTYSARIPVIGDASTATDVAYHVVALAPSLATLATLGTQAEPLQLRIPAESGGDTGVARDPGNGGGDDGGGGNVAEEWWFWLIIGLVVVGGGVTAGVLLGTQEQGPEQGSLGSVVLMQVEF